MPSPNKLARSANAAQQPRSTAILEVPNSTSSLIVAEKNSQQATSGGAARTNSQVSSSSSTSEVVNNIEKDRHSRILAAIKTTDSVKNRSNGSASAVATAPRESKSNPTQNKPIVVAKKKPVLVSNKNKKVVKAKVSKPKFSENIVKYNLANRYYQSGKYQNSIDVLESSKYDTSKHAKIRDLLVLAYTAYARELVSRADMLEAQTILEKALTMQPKNKTIRRQLQSVKNVREAEKVYKTAIDAYNKGKSKQAFKSFARVLSLNPTHKKAKKYHSKIKSVVVDTYHKKALQYYRRQKLSKAIIEWNSLLKVDPSNDLARIYRSRAIELQKKFEKL